MEIINLRNVGPFEITDSYRGILRISPNIIGENVIDDPSDLLYTNNSISLSNSEGNELPLKFTPNAYKTLVIGRDLNEIDLIHITHDYSKLYVSNNLKINSKLYINPTDENIPPILSFTKDGDKTYSLGYPLECPYNVKYVNDEEVRKEEVSVNGEPVKKEDGSNETRKYNYILGMARGGRSKTSNESFHEESADHTQLSFIELDKLIYEVLSNRLKSSFRSSRGRYFNLKELGAPGENNNTANELGKELFGDTAGVETIQETAPLLGIGVQSGTIHYNAIPIRRYLFHCLRHYGGKIDSYLFKDDPEAESQITQADTNKKGMMNTLISEYVLCDGKSIATSYPNIGENKIISELHKKIAKSINDSSEESYDFNTPPLFECNQYSLRFLRGLNWDMNNSEDYEKIFKKDDVTSGYISDKNTRIYNIAGNSINDKSNHCKNIHKVGMHYVNYDSKVQKRYRHSHFLFVKNKEEYGEPAAEAIYPQSKVFFGNNNNELPADNELPVDEEAWKNYVNDTEGEAYTPINDDGIKFPSYILKTLEPLPPSGEINLKYLQNQPIVNPGGPNYIFHNAYSCMRYGHRSSGKCSDSTTYCHEIGRVQDGRYNFAFTNSFDNKWRFITSLPNQHKYGEAKDNLKEKLSTATFDDNLEIDLDDSLANPPSINLLPLMKI